MKRIKLATAFFFAAGSFAMAQTPSTQPALPAGHPDISQMKPAAGIPAPGAPGGMNLPAGHPDISQMRKPTTQQAISGTVAVRAVQGTKDGPAVGADDVVIEFYVKGQLLDRVEGKLDEKGTTSIGGVPLNLNPQPLVRVTHAGVEYQAVGSVMNGGSSLQEIEVPVYETTDQAPQWQVKMHHVMAERSEAGLQVMEMLALDNPTDRAWTGAPIEGTSQRSTLALTLPANAQQIQVIGDHACCAKVEGNKVVNTMPLVPGSSKFQVSYVIPVTEGQAELSVATPAPVKHLMVFLPDDGTTVTAEGLQGGDSTDMGGGKTRFYKAAGLAAGQQVKLAISGITTEKAAAAAGIAGGSTHAAQIVAGLGAVIILLFGIAFLFIKGSPKKA